jgi:hypothetical protein
MRHPRWIKWLRDSLPDTDGVIFSPWKSVRRSILTTTHDF